MKRLLVTLTDEEIVTLGIYAENYDSTPGEILAAFVADLTDSRRRGGSDESMYARDWLYRQTSRWVEGKLIT